MQRCRTGACDDEGGRSAPCSSLEQLPKQEVLKRIQAVRHPSAPLSTDVHEALVLALDLHWLSQSSAKMNASIEQLLDSLRIGSRQGANPFTGLAKLCLPGRHPRDYNRYASALRWAVVQGWSAATFREKLGGRGGMTELARQDRQFHADRVQRQTAEARRAKAVLEHFRRVEPHQQIRSAGPPGPVLLIGERSRSGRIQILEVADAPAHREIARRLLAIVGQAGDVVGDDREES